MDIWLYANKDLINRTYKKTKLKVNDVVRLSKLKGIFQKGYNQTFTKELFCISEILKTHPATFKIRDMHNEILQGIFYEKELLKIPS